MANRHVKVLGINRLRSSILKTFKDVKTSKRLLNEIGEFTIARNQQFARRGKSLEGNDTVKKLPQLQENTKDIRQFVQENFPQFLDQEFFKATKSNVTFTGQLLKSLRFALRDTGIDISVTGRRRKFRKDDLPTNADVYESLQIRGFGFIGLDKKGVKRIKRLIIDEFRRTIKKLF